MPDSAFVVLVPEAQERVHELRERFDASARLGAPAHVTLLVPFMAPASITSSVLADAQRVLGRQPAFDFALAKVARFAETAYLAPEPARPFVALTESLVRRFPGFPPYGGEHARVVPHLTVATGDACEAELAAAALEIDLKRHGPIRATCASVTLLENSSGRWQPMHVFPLARRRAGPAREQR
jgi:2'-5' RNA ligase